jgi:hypothetical protein
MSETGGHAFSTNDDAVAGMTLRDYFAAKCIAAAYQRAPECPEYEINSMFGKSRTGITREEIAAALAYRIAAAMLVARRTAR